MSDRIIEIEANSLDEARLKVNTDELIVLEETVLCYGKVGTIEAVADTVEEAFVKAESKVPSGATTETRTLRIAPKRITLQVQAETEEEAGKGKAEVIASVSLLKKGRKGFWGFGKSPSVYEVVIFQQAVVEVGFGEHAKLQARVRGYLAENLLHAIAEIREQNTEWTEILVSLNPKNDPEIQRLLTSLRELDPLSNLNTIEDICRKNDKANWRIVIEEAHEQASIARARELREHAVRLRGLDVEIADTFGFYTSLDWYSKSFKEPTGIPRYTTDYDHHRPGDERLRKTIPRYSTEQEAFRELERRIKAFELYQFYLQLLFEEGQDELTATLEQKCIAALEARKRSRK